MTWEWVAVIAVVAFWTAVAQLTHAWKEVRMIQAMPPDEFRRMSEAKLHEGIP